MVEAGYLTEGQVYGARMNPAKIVERGDYYSPDWFLDWAFGVAMPSRRSARGSFVSSRTAKQLLALVLMGFAIYSAATWLSRPTAAVTINTDPPDPRE